ncbi:MAG: 1-deoxy-D-xylulose-5-phosphate reductoisomerase [Bacillota bacterium]|nr:1-deoxy-D-xylulose-5-phosphate reductoisomerase [Bacillota bacterium]
MKQLSILGSTGSIGTQTLDIVRRSKGKFSVVSLSAGKNVKLMEAQAREFKPVVVSMADEAAANELKLRLADTNIKVKSGNDGVTEVSTLPQADMVVGAIVGIAGLLPILCAIAEGKDIALANKETLVTAGDIVMAASREAGVKILPVDSEHSAIFQCLQGQSIPKRIILTASGGPFFGKQKDELKKVKKEDALKHPNWTMGSKVTIDSATLMNKGLEVIEASHLFGITADEVTVCVHRQSIIHSMVEFYDGAILAQLGSADMRTPISVALNYPQRSSISGSKLDIFDMQNLTFDKPDIETFSALALAYRAIKEGGTMPAAMNGANEEAVAKFLNDKCGFLDISEYVQRAMDNHKKKDNPNLQDILEADLEAREFVRRL